MLDVPEPVRPVATYGCSAGGPQPGDGIAETSVVRFQRTDHLGDWPTFGEVTAGALLLPQAMGYGIISGSGTRGRRRDGQGPRLA